MKYRRLTKEQFESLDKEFAQFLATQKIDKDQWNEIKINKPELVEEELSIFSDMVWEDVLSKVNYLEHISKNSMNLFKIHQQSMERIVVKIGKNIDLFREEDYHWLLNNSNNESIEYFKGTKKYQKDKKIEIFNLIEKGCQISKGELFDYFNKLIS